MIREILIWPDPVLCQPALPVHWSERWRTTLNVLARDLEETCQSVHGLGLAAPQVGVNLRVALLDVGACRGGTSEFITMVDPAITFQAGDQTSDEGCLSIPNESGTVVRSQTVTVEYVTVDGLAKTLTADGLLACAIQHELDHLDGKVFLDRMSRTKRSIIRERMNRLRKLVARGAVEIRPGHGGFRL